MQVTKRNEDGKALQWRLTGYVGEDSKEYVQNKMDEDDISESEALKQIVREHRQYAEEDN